MCENKIFVNLFVSLRISTYIIKSKYASVLLCILNCGHFRAAPLHILNQYDQEVQPFIFPKNGQITEEKATPPILFFCKVLCYKVIVVTRFEELVTASDRVEFVIYFTRSFKGANFQFDHKICFQGRLNPNQNYHYYH